MPEMIAKCEEDSTVLACKIHTPDCLMAVGWVVSGAGQMGNSLYKHKTWEDK